MPYIYPGNPQISLWSGGAGVGTRLYTWYLPPCDKGRGLGLEWVQKGWWPELYDGSEAARELGWLPELVLQWEKYQDVMALGGQTIGIGAGNLLDFVSLMSVLDNPASNLEVQPGPGAGGLFPNKIIVSPIGIAGNGLAAGVRLTFRSGPIYPSKILPTF
jgi:hypothetical protein